MKHDFDITLSELLEAIDSKDPKKMDTVQAEFEKYIGRLFSTYRFFKGTEVAYGKKSDIAKEIPNIVWTLLLTDIERMKKHDRLMNKIKRNEKLSIKIEKMMEDKKLKKRLKRNRKAAIHLQNLPKHILNRFKFELSRMYELRQINRNQMTTPAEIKRINLEWKSKTGKKLPYAFSPNLPTSLDAYIESELAPN